MRRSVKVTAWLVAAGLLATGSSADDKGAAAKVAAQEAATAWLALVDRGDYAESWNQASSLFRGAVTRDAWVAAVKSVRGPLGAVRERKLKSAEYTTTLPGAPDGEYIVIQYETVLERKAAAVETVTPMLDTDGQWRVSGYFIK